MAPTAAEAKDRDERIQAAKKKVSCCDATTHYFAMSLTRPRTLRQLKTYRAKQAQMERAKRGSITLTAAQAKRASTSVALAVENKIVQAAQEAQDSLPASQATPPAAPSHARANSRAGHGRGHSRVGSISITAESMASTAVNAIAASLQPATPTATTPTARARPSSFVASSSRRHSRNLSIHLPSRPVSSTTLGSTPASAGANILAVERDPGSFGPSGKPSDWQDVDEEATIAKLQPAFSPSPSVTPKAPLQTFSNANEGVRSTDSLPSHSRRPSRHSRKPSLATKRESMEIMGGLGFPSTDSNFTARSSRRFSSNRHSGFQSASLLFGGGNSSSNESRRSGARDFDWRGSFGCPSDREVEDGEGGDDRRTALEKLEGKAAAKSAASPHTPSDRRHSRQSSVQLPTFDEIHGEEGMDKHSTLNLLEANERTTLEEEPVRSPRSLLSPNVGMSTSQSMPELSSQKSPRARPASLFITTDASQAEGLTTLVEEEEEDETSSPLKERKAMDSLNKGSGAVEDEAAQQRRRQSELETAQRTRRLGLQPKPLKLKSRPTSLYVSSTMQRVAGLPQLMPSQSGDADDEASSTVDSTSTIGPSQSAGELSRDWAMPRTGSVDAGKALKRRSMPLGSLRPLNMGGASAGETAADALPSPPTNPARPGMRALRLASSSSNGSISTISSDSTSASAMHKPSLSRAVDTSSPTSTRRSSIIYKPSSSSSDATVTSPSSIPASASTMAIIEELKAKNLRDTGALDGLRSQIDALTAQLAQETERAALEYSQLEQRSAAEKHALTSRIDEMESTQQARQVQWEQEKEAVASELRQQVEDLEAERDMLAEDVDGWRTRCTGLEKSLRDERASTESERQKVASLHLHIKSLQDKLRQEGLEVAATPTGSDESPSRSLTIPSDVIAALRSPALDPNAPTSTSYFPPGNSPSELPSAQTVKLLKDMRQQIFNLAGSLEHERREHLRAQKEADELKDQNSQLAASLESEKARRESRTASTLPHHHHGEEASHECFTPMEATTWTNDVNHEHSAAASPSSSSRNKRHVFAYDSSMGSMDQSSMSMGSGTTNATSVAESDNGSLTLDEKHEGPLLPGGLQPLAEEEESSSAVGADESEIGQQQQQQHARGQSIVDLEAGGQDDDEEDWTDDHAAEVYDTPSLEPSATFASAVSSPAQQRPQVAIDSRVVSLSNLSGSGSGSGSGYGSKSSGESARGAGERSSTTSSVETYGPASPVDLENAGGHEDFVEEEEAEEDDEGTADHVNLPRPEFIREWSYRDALDAALSHQSKGARRGGKGGKKSHRNVPSIDDFFGLRVCEQLEPLPPLPSTHSTLDMPPVYVEYYDDDDAAVQVPTAPGKRGSAPPPARHAMIAGSQKGGRPPVARSAFIRDSSQSSLDSGLTRSNSSRSYSSNSNSATFSSPDRDRGGSSGMALASAGGLGSRALGRVSLQGLTSAFSGLGGYLAGQSGAAVHAAATATTMCAKGGPEGFDIESRNPSMSYGQQGNWPMALQQDGGGALKSIVGTSGAKRFSSAVPNDGVQAVYGRTSMSSAGSNTARTPTMNHQQLSSQQQSKGSGNRAPARRFLDVRDIAPPQASPVWRLDFVGSTEGLADAFTV